MKKPLLNPVLGLWFSLLRPSLLTLCVVALLSQTSGKTFAATPSGGALDGERYRLIVSSDIGGNDPDDIQSMVHLFVYADMFDIEGLISSPPYAGRKQDILDVIDAYELDYPNLATYSSLYPTANELRAMSYQGETANQSGSTPNRLSAGAQHIINRAKANDSRPLYVAVWGAITDVAQAVHADPSIKNKIRVYSIGSWNTFQDSSNARNYLYNNHPDLWWIENDTTFRGMYTGGTMSGDLGNTSFIDQHVKGHGALGDYLFNAKPDIKMGDTPSILYLMTGNPNDPTGESWGGSFVTTGHSNTFWTDDPDPAVREGNRNGAKTVNKWRENYLRDWQGRMDRAKVASGNEIPNSPPEADAGEDQSHFVSQGTETFAVTLDGSGSLDPDLDDLTFNWTWAGGSASGVNPTVNLNAADSPLTITLTVSDVENATDTDELMVTLFESTGTTGSLVTTVEIDFWDEFDGFIFRISNDSSDASIVSVEMSTLGGGLFDGFGSDGSYTVTPDLSASKENPVTLTFPAGLAPGASASGGQVGDYALGDIDRNWSGIQAVVTYDDGTTLTSELTDVGDTDDGDPRLFQALLLGGEMEGDPPVVPSGFIADQVGEESVSLSWNDVSDELFYSLERRQANDTAWTTINAVIPADTTSFVDLDLESSTTYEYRLEAINAAGPSGFTAPLSATTLVDTGEPVVIGEWAHFGEVMFGGNYDAAVTDDGNVFIFGSESRIINELGVTLWQDDRGDNEMEWIDQVPAVSVDPEGGLHAISRVSGSATGGFDLDYQYRPKNGNWSAPIRISNGVPRNYAVGVAGISADLAYVVFSEEHNNSVWGRVNLHAIEQGQFTSHGSINGFRIDNILDFRRAGNRIYLAFGNNSPNGFTAYHSAEIQPSVAATYAALEDSQVRFTPPTGRRGFPRLFPQPDGSVDMTMGSQFGNAFWARTGTDGSLAESDFVQVYDDLGDWHLSVGMSAAATLPGTDVVLVAGIRSNGGDSGRGPLVTKLSYDGGQTWEPEVKIVDAVRAGEGRGRINVLAKDNLFFVGYPLPGTEGAMGMSRYAVEVSGIPLAITEEPLPGGVEEVAYDYSFSVTGATDPVDWSVTAGSLPPGLILSSDGTISGTPTTAGSYNFTVEAIDADDKSDTSAFTLAVAAPPSGDGVIIMDAGVVESGPSGGSATSFTVENTGAPGNYLIVGVINESGEATSLSFGGAPMTLLSATSESATYTSFWGVETSQISGQVDVQFNSNVFGTQIFSYHFLSGVDTSAPVRTEAGLGDADGSGSLILAFPGTAAVGDLALLLGVENNRNGGVSASPVDTTLFAGPAGATFSGLVAHATMESGSYSPEFTFTTGERSVASGIIVASQPATPPPSGLSSFYDLYELPASQREAGLDLEGDGIPLILEYIFELHPTEADQPGYWIEDDNGTAQLLFRLTDEVDGAIWQIAYSDDLEVWTIGYSSDGVTGNPDGTISVMEVGTADDGVSIMQASLPASNPIFTRIIAFETAP